MVKGIIVTTVLFSLVPSGGEMPNVTYAVISSHPRMKVQTPLFSLPGDEARVVGKAAALPGIALPHVTQGRLAP